VLRSDATLEVVGLLTTLNQVAKRVAMHAVREDLLEAQAAALGLPVLKVPIPDPCSNEEYESAMEKAMDEAGRMGVEAVAFGDLFLEDVRRYREQRLAPTGMHALFPLWGRPTGELAGEMVSTGLRAFVTAVDPRQLSPAFAGRMFNAGFLSALPEGVDPCGENGEFHTFAFDGPMFRAPLPIEPGVIVERGGFVFADVMLRAPTSTIATARS
jgi:uncharacterized protein (TIGR00290 family)